MKKLSYFQKTTIKISILAVLATVLVGFIGDIPSFIDRVRNPRKHLLGVVNSFDISIVENTEINVSFINTGNKEVSVIDLTLVGFFNDNVVTSIDEYFYPAVEYFEIKPTEISLNVPINIEREKIKSFSVYVDLESFTISDPPVPPQIRDDYGDVVEPSNLFLQFYPYETFRDKYYFCISRFISFSFVITLLDLEGNKTISFMPISYGCEFLKITIKHTEAMDLFDRTYILHEYHMP